MNNSFGGPNNDLLEGRWIVDFEEFRVRNEVQRRAIDELQEMAFEVVQIWLKVLTPDAVVVKSTDQSARHISFHHRSEMRRFIQSFGGRQIRHSKNSGRP
jgi:hypothetical protein